MSVPEYTVFRKQKSPAKDIIQGVSGTLAPGRLAALMGPSGAGKSTLLRALSLRTPESSMSGQILYNGVRPTVLEASSISCFIYQSECFLANLTVDEHLEFQSLLRLGQLDAQTRKHRKDLMVDQMGLRKCINTAIGGIMKKGISGGEQKRLNISSEILTSPSVIFADEPTTSLDSALAMTVVQRLRSLADCGRTVICTIHQPSSRIFNSFDDVILMSYGRQLYGGDRLGALGWMASQGFRAPLFGNPADVIVSWANIPWESSVEGKFAKSAKLGSLWERERVGFLKHWMATGRSEFLENMKRKFTDYLIQHEVLGLSAINRDELIDGVRAKSKDFGTKAPGGLSPTAIIPNKERARDLASLSKTNSFALPAGDTAMLGMIPVRHESRLEQQQAAMEELLREMEIQKLALEKMVEPAVLEGKVSGAEGAPLPDPVEANKLRQTKIVTILESLERSKTSKIERDAEMGFTSISSTRESCPAIRTVAAVFDPSIQTEVSTSFVPAEVRSKIEKGWVDERYEINRRIMVHKQLEDEFGRVDSVIADPDIMRDSQAKRLSGWKQFGPLWKRSSLSISRDPTLVTARLMQTVIIGVVMGLIDWRLGWDQYSSESRLGMVFSVVMNQGMQGCYQMTSTFSQELEYVQREYNSNILSPGAYVVSKMIADLPLQIIFPVVFNAIVYWCANMSNSISVFFITCGEVILSSSAALSMGYLAAASTTTVDAAVIVANLLMLPMQLFSGFQVRLSLVPSWIAWLQYLSFYKYGFSAYAGSVFTSEQTVSFSDGSTMPADEFLDANYGVTSKELVTDLCGLAALMVGFRLLAMGAFGIILHVRKAKT